MAAISAFLQTVAEENPKVRVRTVIADAANTGLIDEAVKGDGAREVRYRDGQREVKTFVELSPQNEGIGWFRPRRSVLDHRWSRGTRLGFLGAFGAKLSGAPCLARSVRVGSRSVGADRTTQSSGSRGAVRARRRYPEPEEVYEVVRQAKARFGRLHGVIHAAGGAQQFPPPQANRRLASGYRRQGLRYAEPRSGTGHGAVGCFSICSSIASMLPEAGQSDYAFANRFLDEFASRREELRDQGSGAAERWRSTGKCGVMEALSPVFRSRNCRRGRSKRCNSQGCRRLPLSKEFISWSNQRNCRLVPVSSATEIERNFSTGLPECTEPFPRKGRRQKLYLDERRLYAQTEAYVKTLVSDLLKLSPERFEADNPFSEYGLDSILITKFNGRIAKDLPDVSKTLLFEYPNAAALSRYLVEAHRADLATLFKDEPCRGPEGLRQVSTAPTW